MSNLNDKDRLDQAVETIDEAKRTSMRKLLLGAVYAAPVVSTFAVTGMMVSTSAAQGATHSNAH